MQTKTRDDTSLNKELPEVKRSGSVGNNMEIFTHQSYQGFNSLRPVMFNR